MKIKMVLEKATKNTIRFTEQLESELDAPKLGTIYVPKQTLQAIGWREGMELVVDMSAE